MPDLVAQLGQNLAGIRGRMADAAARSGRRPDQVQLLVVTKYVGPREIRAVLTAGCAELAESRPQQLWERAQALADLPIRWHLIGHLQRNKVRRTLPLVCSIHSVDSLRLAAAIDEETVSPLPPGEGPGVTAFPLREGQTISPLPLGEGQGVRASPPRRRIPVLMEVNVSGEPAKHGLMPDELDPLLPHLAALRNLEVRGLMCMAGLEGGLDAARRQFAALRCLRDRLRKNCPPGIDLADLSMGMSGDFEVAIEEGATIVRIGSAVFEGILDSGFET